MVGGLTRLASDSFRPLVIPKYWDLSLHADLQATAEDRWSLNLLSTRDKLILNFEDERLGFGQDRAQSHRALVGKFDGVAQKVDQDLAKAHLVGFNNFGQVLVPIQFEFDPFALGGPSHHLYSLLEEGVK